jgi:predicted O-methyltransferase YrrM
MSATSVVDAPQHVHDLLQRLHAKSLVQEKELEGENGKYAELREAWGKDPVAAKKMSDDMMRDKFIALTVDKALFVYQLLRATGALNVVEAGTSYGVSTIYLAHAIGQNAKAQGKGPGDAKVIATENEPEKAARAREHWNEAGETVLPWIELREGDLLQTLKNDLPEIDLVLLDSTLTHFLILFALLMDLQSGHR